MCTDKNIHNIKKNETELRKSEKWIKSNELSLNYKKTNAVVFSHKMHDNFCITTQNETIHARDIIKYHWYMIDCKPTWKTRIHYVVQKLRVAKGILNKIKYMSHNQF